MLDECKGERLEEVLAAFSSAVLKKLVAERSLNGGLEYRPTIAERLALENWGYSGDRTSLNALLLAHKVSLTSLLAKKDRARQRYKDFEELLLLKERNLAGRKEQSRASSKTEPRIRDSTREETRRILRTHWTGNEQWIDSLLLSDTNPPKGGFLGTDFDELWTSVENGKISDIESQNTGLLEQLDERVRLQKMRLERWNGFREKMFGKKPTSSPKKKDHGNKSKSCGIQFNAHQNITVTQEDKKKIASRVTSLPTEYAKILEGMKSDFDSTRTAKIPDFTTLLRTSRHQSSLGSFQGLSIPKGIEELIPDINEWEDEPEESHPAPKPTKLPTTRNIRYNQAEANPLAKRRQPLQPRAVESRAPLEDKDNSDFHPDPDPPKPGGSRIATRTSRLPYHSEPDHALQHPPTDRAASPEAISPIQSPLLEEQEREAVAPPPAKPEPEPEAPPPPRQVSPTQALADEILASMSNASPSPAKKKQQQQKPSHALSLAERTRLSMARALSYPQDDGEDGDGDGDGEDDVGFDPLPRSPAKANNPQRSHGYTRSEPVGASTTAEAEAGAETADGDEYEDLVARTRRSMAGFEAAQQRARLERRRSERRSRMPPPSRKDSRPARAGEDGDTSIIEELLDADLAEVDMEAVFMSRPKIKASPPPSPVKMMASWDDGA